MTSDDHDWSEYDEPPPLDEWAQRISLLQQLLDKYPSPTASGSQLVAALGVVESTPAAARKLITGIVADLRLDTADAAKIIETAVSVAQHLARDLGQSLEGGESHRLIDGAVRSLEQAQLLMRPRGGRFSRRQSLEAFTDDPRLARLLSDARRSARQVAVDLGDPGSHVSVRDVVLSWRGTALTLETLIAIVQGDMQSDWSNDDDALDRPDRPPRRDVEHTDLDGGQLRRQETLTEAEAGRYIGAFEAAFQAVIDAAQEGLIAPDAEADVINLMRQFELAWHRGSVKTAQLELLIAELLEVLNGDIDDEGRFRAEFERLGAKPDVAAVLAHRLAMTIVDAREHLGTDDPAEAAKIMQRAAEHAEELQRAERGLFDDARDAYVKGAATAAGAGTVTATGGAVWAYRDQFVRIARELVVGLGRLFQSFYGG